MLRFAEFFAGIGLVRLALERAGWQCVFANDIDPKKTQIYRHNFGAEELIEGDVWDIDHGSMPDAIDLVTASFPCIDLSLAGNREGLRGRHSSALWGFIDKLEHLVETKRSPKLVLLENVLGFITSHRGRDLRQTIKRLNNLGYVCDAAVIDAKRFTAQSRPRVFVLASNDGVSIADPYEWVEEPAVLRPERLRQFMLDNADLAWSQLISDEPPVRSGTLTQIIEKLPVNHVAWWSTDKVEKVFGQMSRLHKSIAEHLMSRTTVTVGTIYRRVRNGRTMAELRTDGLAGCLRVPRGGSSKQFVAFLGRGVLRVRNMTPREYGRLQGVPDSFWIPENANQAMAGFGDAVCVPAVEWLAKTSLNRLMMKVTNTKRSRTGAVG